MAAIVNDETGVERSVEGFSNGQRYHAGEALAEWRSSEQLENGTPSTSPLYWDTDDDDDSGPKPSELYGKYTWRIEKFSQINKRELRSNAFEVGGYKWYILIYPQGCDVSNHLSLFLCVANHEKLLPGWSHFAQFTIAVVNKDPKKSKYSDTLHRFWKKEHDWGWKKFMELSKVSDGFLEADTLIIKAQVQVIRESAHRPFRCLDCEYRRELVRVYLTNVEQVCRRFVEERRGKLSRLIEDKSRWSSFCAFWLGIDQNMRRRMSREKSDVILKVAVKHFFIEKEVTSTLVMDSLYSGLKALEGQCKGNKRKSKFLDHDEIPAPIICIEKDMFVLVDDVLLLLERAALEPLPPKDEKAPQNRTKDGNSGEDFNKDSIERDERRLTELGRRTVEIFVLAHIFSNKIEVAYQEAVALRRQEELIREEEAAWLAEVEQKAKRGASEKEKKSKKKQAKQKRNSRKGKDKARDEKSSAAAQVISEQNSCADEKEASNTEETQLDAEIFNTQDVSDISDVMDGVGETLLPGSEDRDPSPVNWDTDASEVHPPIEGSSSEVTGLSCIQNGGADKTNTSMVDDSSSTCSTDSVPSVVMSGPYKGSTFSNHQGRKSRGRGKNHRDKVASDVSSCTTEADCEASGPVADAVEFSNVSGSGKAVDSERDPEPEAVVSPSQDQIKCLDQKTATEEAPLKMCVKYSSDSDRTKEVMSAVQSSHSTPKNASPAVQFRSEQKSRDPANPVPVRKRYPSGSQPDQEMSSSASSQVRGTLNSEPETIDAYKDYKPGEKHVSPLVPVTSRPSSTNTPPVPASRSNAPVVSPIPTATMPARSAGAVGRLGPDPTPATHSHVPQSYRNAILGNHVVSSSGVSNHNSSSSGVSQSPAFAQPPSMASTPVFLPQNSERLDASSVQSSFPFARLSPDELHNGEQQMESSPRDVSRSLHGSLLLSGTQNFDLSKQFNLGSREQFSSEFRPCTSGRQSQGVLADEFPHLDIINDLLNEEHGIGRAARARMGLQSVSNGSQSLNRQFSFPPNISMPGEPGSSSSSCRFERTRSFQDGRFQRGYSSSNEHFNSLPEYVPQANQQSYANGHMDGLIPIQWQMASSDIMAIRSTEGENFPYHSPEYSNVECGMNGYAVYQPSKGL